MLPYLYFKNWNDDPNEIFPAIRFKRPNPGNDSTFIADSRFSGTMENLMTYEEDIAEALFVYFKATPGSRKYDSPENRAIDIPAA